MSVFRTKLLGLAALGMAFAGLSYGQTFNGASCAAAIVPTPNPTLRAEGETELVADVTWTGCTVGVAETSAALIASLSPLVVTSKSVSGNQLGAFPAPVAPATTVAFTGNSDAVLIVTTPLANGTAFTAVQYFPGTATGTSVTFQMPCTVTTVISASGPTSNNCLTTGVSSFTVTNIRVNAVGAAASQVAETLLLQVTTVAAGVTSTTNQSPTAGSVNVGFILPSLSFNLPAGALDRKSTRLNSSHSIASRMPSSA